MVISRKPKSYKMVGFFFKSAKSPEHKDGVWVESSMKGNWGGGGGRILSSATCCESDTHLVEILREQLFKNLRCMFADLRGFDHHSIP